MQEPLKESDVRAIVRLLGEVARVSGNLQEKRRALMNGLLELIEADFWTWAKMGRLNDGEPVTFSITQHGGFTDQQLANFLKANEHPEMVQLESGFLDEYNRTAQHITRLDWQVLDPDKYPDSKVKLLFEDANIGSQILSLYPVPSGYTAGIGIFRAQGRGAYSKRESRIAHIILSEIDWLHDDSWDEEKVRSVFDLSPRLNTTLNLAVQGLSRQEIADRLEISIHTINGYFKDLYRRFGVHSQAQLIKRFIEGDGGDTPKFGG